MEEFCKQMGDFMNNYKKKLIYISISVFWFLFILTIIFIALIINDTLKNPLEKENQFDKLNYFNDNSFGTKQKCKCGEKILLNFCSEDLLLSGCININENNTLINLNENLGDCKDIEESIMSHNFKLIDIFQLNTNNINSSSKGLLAVNILLFIFGSLVYVTYNKCLSILTGLFTCDWEKARNKEEEGKEECCYVLNEFFITIIWILFILICLIVDIIIFSTLCGVYNIDDTSKFLKFLECNNVNIVGFDKYLVLRNLSYHFSLLKFFQSLFIIYVFFYLFISIILKCINLINLYDKNKKGNNSKDKDEILLN